MTNLRVSVSLVLGFPLVPSPSGVFPATFDAPDVAPENPNLMAYTRPEEARAGRVQEVQVAGEFRCGRSELFVPDAVYLREFFWESGVRDQWETVKHPSQD